MQGFNPELKIGMQAMIIGTHQPKNSHVIGKMVTIEGLGDAGELRDEWFNEIYVGIPLPRPLALISGIGTGAGIVDGHSTIQQKYLMPLPPLDDDDMIFANENTKELEKC